MSTPELKAPEPAFGADIVFRRKWYDAVALFSLIVLNAVLLFIVATTTAPLQTIGFVVAIVALPALLVYWSLYILRRSDYINAAVDEAVWRYVVNHLVPWIEARYGVGVEDSEARRLLSGGKGYIWTPDGDNLVGKNVKVRLVGVDELARSAMGEGDQGISDFARKRLKKATAEVDAWDFTRPVPVVQEGEVVPRVRLVYANKDDGRYGTEVIPNSHRSPSARNAV